MKSIIFVVALFIVGFYYYSWSFMATILVLSAMIFFHELGHFLVAKMLGVCVNTFSIGFGEKLLKKRIGQTEYAISAIPLGGYVQLKGQDDIDPSNRNFDPDSYNTLHPLGRIAILFAGPFFNFIMAFFLFVWLGYLGVDKISPVIDKVVENSAAQKAGIMANDKILSIDSKPIASWDEISRNVKDAPLSIKVDRNGTIHEFVLTPIVQESKTIFGESIKRPLIGISPSNKVVKVYNTGFQSFTFAYNETIRASKLIFLSIQKMIEGVIPIKEVGGIVQITDVTSKAAKSDFTMLIIITALISVNLGVLNLLPIPALDGGHIIFNIYELIFRREVNQKVFVYFTYFGWILLISLMLLATYNDIVRLVKA
ncbi:MAG: RIP metalloprotease RseP [Campylobacter sp.]|nr:RIP metalloprotease RseP [Campylobacter sp.]